MLKSMTGYGRDVQTLNGRKITIELRSVNHRYLDVSIRCPRVYSFLEESVKAMVQSLTARGKLDLFISIETPASEEVQILLNTHVLERYLEAFRVLRDEYSITDDVTVTRVARLPEVFDITHEEADAQSLKEDVLCVLKNALLQFNQMREIEGEKLKADIMERISIISQYVQAVEERSPKTVEEYRQKLEQRMNELLVSVNIDQQRILTEAAIFADKTSVSEETVRLKSHLAQLVSLLKSEVPVGRKLDFLVQELNREANTIGSKANDYEISKTVVELKSEIEKIREQIQNLE
ncbi:MAG: YicC family protein [Clostridiales bacterium]|nr:YicC family protein [Clostridiales bacterium]